MTIYLSIIIPCWNEEENLKNGVLLEVFNFLKKQCYLWEVIIINDGSTDNSKKKIEEFIKDYNQFYLFDIKHSGKAIAILEGIKKSKGEILLFIDMDQSSPISELKKLLFWYDKGFDVVIGSRGLTRKGHSIPRKIASFTFLNIRRLFLLRDLCDTQCGFKLFNKKAILHILPFLQCFEKSDTKVIGWKVTAYDIELLYLLKKLKYRIKEANVYWHNKDLSITKRSNITENFLKESLIMAKEISFVLLNTVKGLYKNLQ